MTEKLSNSIKEIRQFTPGLNAATDEANRVVAAVEKFLTDECSVGLPAEVYAAPTSGGYLNLQYARVAGKFKIAVGTFVPGRPEEYTGADTWDLQELKAWSESPRSEKLVTFAKLPELLNEIASRVTKTIDSTSKTASTVEAILNALKK